MIEAKNIHHAIIQAVSSNTLLSCLLATAVLVALGWYMKDSLKIDDIQHKYVFVTGCDSGFGNLLARQLDRKGYNVVAACLTEKGVSELQASASSRLKTVLLNVTDSASIDMAVELVHAEVGERGLWGLVNNAGRSIPIGTSDWMQMEDFKKVLDVNLIGLIEVTLKLLPLVKKARGRVVNMSSVLGRLAIVGGGYSVSKWGVEAFSDSLRRDMRFFGVKVSIIEPGYFKTGATDMDATEADLWRLWNQLSAEVKSSYGDRYMEKYLQMQQYRMDMLCSTDLSKVTWCMEHALTARHPRTRYAAGWDAKIIWIPLSYLPSSITNFTLYILLSPHFRK
ncbi:retinol dehydrogenase 7-like isoform X1 [Paramormyrops kingsleyae]|uniref:retinol dehydrogenase 7-like isoform X1 n=2 Tax=Paramormyrops kingsleyae TaxID=1676925 RepID=UPI003B9757CB